MSLLKPGEQGSEFYYDMTTYATVCGGRDWGRTLLKIDQSPNGETWDIIENYNEPNKYPTLYRDLYIITPNGSIDKSTIDRDCLRFMPVVEIAVRRSQDGESITLLGTRRNFLNFNEAIRNDQVKKQLFEGLDKVENMGLVPNFIPPIFGQWFYNLNPFKFSDKQRLLFLLGMVGVGIYGAHKTRKDGWNIPNVLMMGVGGYGAFKLTQVGLSNPSAFVDVWKK